MLCILQIKHSELNKYQRQFFFFHVDFGCHCDTLHSDMLGLEYLSMASQFVAMNVY